MNELKAQSQIVGAVRDAGGFGEKLSHRFKVGIPDLFIKMRDQHPFVIEVKYERMPKRESTSIEVGLTPAQRNFLRGYDSVHGVAAWLLVVDCGSGVLRLLADRDIEINYVTQAQLLRWGVTKERGRPWPIQDLWTSLLKEGKLREPISPTTKGPVRTLTPRR